MLPSRREEMKATRLCDAATACLLAAAEVGHRSGRACPYPADVMGTPLQPRCLDPFERWEVDRACEFLVRMGMLEPRTAFPSKPAKEERGGRRGR